MHTHLGFGRLWLGTALCKPGPFQLVPHTHAWTEQAPQRYDDEHWYLSQMLSEQQQQLHILSVPAGPAVREHKENLSHSIPSRHWLSERFVLTAKRSLCLSSLEM